MQNQTYLNIQRSRYYWLILIKRTTKGSFLAKIKGISKRNSFSKIKQIVSMVGPSPPFFTLPLTTVSHVIATIFNTGGLRLLRSPTTKSWALSHLPGEQVNRQQSMPQGYLYAPITGSWVQDFKWGVGVRSSFVYAALILQAQESGFDTKTQVWRCPLVISAGVVGFRGSLELTSQSV